MSFCVYKSITTSSPETIALIVTFGNFYLAMFVVNFRSLELNNWIRPITIQSLLPEEPIFFLLQISKFCYQQLFDNLQYPQVIRDQRNTEKCIRDYGGVFLSRDICYLSNLLDRFSRRSGTIHSLTHSFQCIISDVFRGVGKGCIGNKCFNENENCLVWLIWYIECHEEIR